MREISVNKIFREYGVERFGSSVMANVTEEQVDEARRYAFLMLLNLTEQYGKQEHGTAERLFCEYISEEFLKNAS